MGDALLQSFSLLQTRLDETFALMSGNIIVVNSGPIGPTGALGPTGGQFVGPTGATGLGATGATGPTGAGVPAGGSTGQILAKKSGTAYDTEWVNNSGGAVGATGQFTFNAGSSSTGSAALSYSPTGPTGTTATGPTITIGAHLVPSAHQTYDLGTTGKAFRDIYLKGTTIYLGNQTISTDGTGLSFNGNAIAGPNTVSEKFTVAVGSGLAYTYDGLTWISSASGAALFDGCFSVAWNGSIWVAAGTKYVDAVPTGVIAYSRDGINWLASAGIPAIFTACLAVAWNGSVWVAGGFKIVEAAPNGAIAYSSNGITWTTSIEIPAIFAQCLGFAWNGSLWFAVGSLASAGALATSSTGVTWTASEAISVIFSQCNAVAWNGSLLVAVGELSVESVIEGVIATSTDGETWQASELNITSTRYNAVAWNGSMWVAGGENGDVAIIAYSYNGTTWFQSEDLSSTLSNCKSIAWNGSVWLAGTTNYTFPTNIAYSYDGYKWTGIDVSSIFASQCLGLASRNLLYTGTKAPPIPPGGDTGQVLAKVSGAPYDLTWTTAGGGGPVGATGQFTFNAGSGSTGSAALSYSPTGPTGTSATGATITVGAHLVPNANQTYDIGATGLAFRDIYLKGNTIHLGSQKISTDGTGIFFNSSSLLNFKMYTYALDGASPITITPPSNCIAARITMSGGGGGGGNDGNVDEPGGGGGAAGACSIHMVPFIGATACTLTLGVGGGYVDEEGGGGGGGGGETTYSFVINSITYEITCGGGGGGWGNGEGGPGGGAGGGNGGNIVVEEEGTVETVATRGSTITPFGGYLNYNPISAGDGGDSASGTPGMINPLGGYGGAGAGAGGTAGAGGFAIFEWIYR